MILNELIDVLVEARDKRGLGKTKVAFHGGTYGGPRLSPRIFVVMAEHGEKFVYIYGDEDSKYVDFGDEQSGDSICP